MKQLFWGVLWALVLFGTAGCMSEPECGEFPLSTDQRRCVVETIDEMVEEHYPFAEYKGLDLDEFSRQLQGSLVDKESSDVEFLGEINQALRFLDDGHTRMEQRLLAEPARAPLSVDVDDRGQYRVVAAEREELAWLRGRQVAAIDGVAVDKTPALVGGLRAAGEQGLVSLSGPDAALAGEAGTRVELTLANGEQVRLDRRSVLEAPRVERYGDIGYLRLDTFGFIDDLERLDAAINEVMDTKGLIIDIRSNGGGFPSVSDGLFGRLIDEEVPAFRLVHKNGEVDRKMEAKPRGETYEGEVVLLVNGRSYSASNFFAHRMIYHKRGILIGERTGGGAASPKKGVQLLPGIWFQVSSHLVLPPDGKHMESGIEPAISVGPDGIDVGEEGVQTSSLRVEGDPVLNRALRYLEEIQ